jgi:hypothetical protein
VHDCGPDSNVSELDPKNLRIHTREFKASQVGDSEDKLIEDSQNTVGTFQREPGSY